MPFQPGHPRPEGAGRKKGTPNKAGTRVLEELLARGKKPIDEILSLIDNEQIRPSQRLESWLKLLAYCYPTLKMVEVSGDAENPIVVTNANAPMLAQLAREGLKKVG